MLSKRKSEGNLSGKVLFDGAVPNIADVKRFTAYIQALALFCFCFFVFSCAIT